MKRKTCGELEEADPTTEEVSVRRRILFDSEDSDDKVFFDTQAHKKRKMGKEYEELKLLITSELAAQTKVLMESISANTTRGLKNEAEIANLRGAITRIETAILPGTQAIASTSSYAAAAGTIPKTTDSLILRRQPRTSKERESFDISRRSLRLWPIEGSNAKI